MLFIRTTQNTSEKLVLIIKHVVKSLQKTYIKEE